MSEVKQELMAALMREWQNSKRGIEEQSKFYDTNKILLKAEKHFITDAKSDDLFCEMRYTCEDFGFMQGLKCAFALFKETLEALQE